MAANHTYTQIAENFQLWGEFMDPNGEMTEDEFDALSTEKKVQLQVEAFGQEEAGTDD